MTDVTDAAAEQSSNILHRLCKKLQIMDLLSSFETTLNSLMQNEFVFTKDRH